MTEQEVMAQQVAGDRYGLSLEDEPARARQPGRLWAKEREAFNAGWDAAKAYYAEAHAKIAEAMCPTGGRLWTDEQLACFNALTDCAANIRSGRFIE